MPGIDAAASLFAAAELRELRSALRAVDPSTLTPRHQCRYRIYAAYSLLPDGPDSRPMCYQFLEHAALCAATARAPELVLAAHLHGALLAFELEDTATAAVCLDRAAAAWDTTWPGVEDRTLTPDMAGLRSLLLDLGGIVTALETSVSQREMRARARALAAHDHVVHDLPTGPALAAALDAIFALRLGIASLALDKGALVDAEQLPPFHAAQFHLAMAAAASKVGTDPAAHLAAAYAATPDLFPLPV